MATGNETSNEDGVEYIYRRYRRCGNKTLDAYAYGLKAWRLRVRRKKGDGK